MKINKLSVMTVLAAGGLVACSNSAMAQDQKPDAPGRRGQMVERRMERLTEQLKLTDEQKPKVQAALEQTAKKMQDLRGAPADDRAEKMKAIREEENKKLKEILTADQYTKYEKIREQRGPGGPGAPGGEGKKKRDAEKAQ